MLEFVKSRLPLIRNVFVSSFILFILIGGLAIGVFLVQQRQIFREKASVSNVDLTMIPSSVSVAPGDTFTIAISVNPNGNSVSAGNVILNYPANGLSLDSIEPGPFFMKNFNTTTTEMLNKIDKSTVGTATILLGAPCTVQAPWVCYPNSATDNYAILHFKALAVSTNSVSFASGTQIAAVGKTDNVVGDMTGSQVTVTSTSPPGNATLSFQIKFQGITTQKPDQKVKVTLKGGQTFSDVNVSSNASGVYSGSVTGITPGTYEVLVKGPKHLTKNFGAITFVANQTVTNDWSAGELLAGDTNGDDIINGADILRVIEDYFPDSPPNSPGDFNLDGTVNGADILLAIENYFKEGDK